MGRREHGQARLRWAAVLAALAIAVAGCGGDEDDAASDAAPPSAGDDAGTEQAGPEDGGDTMSEGSSQRSVQRDRSSGSKRVVTDDAIATPAPRDEAGTGTAVAEEDAVVEAAVADRCQGPGLDLARAEGDDAEPVAGYATVLGALASWRVEDGGSTRSVSIVDSTRPDDASVAVCYYDGRFPDRAGREVTRIGVVVHDDGNARIVLRGTSDSLGLHRPPTT